MSLLPCHQCGHGYHVEGHPSGQVYTCPRCRDDLDRGPIRSQFESRLEPLTDEDRHQIAAQLLELRAERDRAIADRNHLADGLAHALGMDAGHPLPCSMLASVRIVVAAADAVREERDRLAADLDAVRRAAWALLAVDGGDGHYDAARCYNARVALRLLVGEPPPAPDPAED